MKMKKIMKQNERIAAYCRISVDDDIGNENVSIENQKVIIGDYIKEHFPNTEYDFFEDRDKSGYTFDERDGYRRMRKLIGEGVYNTVIIKDFSRFSRRNSSGLLELEQLCDTGVRIISIEDNIDYPNNAEWLLAQYKFIIGK